MGPARLREPAHTFPATRVQAGGMEPHGPGVTAGAGRLDPVAALK